MLITQAEFARLAGVSRSAVKQAINNALITAVVKQGGKILIDKNAGLQEYQTNSRRQKNPRPAASTLTATEPVAETGLDLLSWGQAPTQKKEQLAAPSDNSPPLNPGEVPILNDERALHEREKRLIAEMDRKAKEGELLHRDDVTTAWNNAVNLTRTKLLGVPTVVKQRIPHLELEEVEVITGLIREALEELAAGEVTA